MNVDNRVDMSDLITTKEFDDYPHMVEVDVVKYPPAKIKQLIWRAGDLIQEYVDKPIMKQVVTEEVPGNGGDKLFLNGNPQALMSCIEYQDVGTSTNISLSNLKLNGGLVQRKSDFFYSAYTYKFKYASGKSKLPQQVRVATILTVADMIRKADYIGLESIKVDVIQIKPTKQVGVLTEEVKHMLKPWKIKARVR